jgi:hypothetical protein
MSKRDDYTVEEWEAIRRAPAESVIAIEQASPSGFWGKRRERKAAIRSFSDAIATTAGLELVDAIVAARDEEGRLIDALRSGGESYLDTAIETARTARRAISEKGTREEVEAFVGAVLAAAEAVALAGGERGGPGRLSAAEALLLRRLAGALGRPDYEPPSDDSVLPTPTATPSPEIE